MFERYTEKARRTIFFGRYEASQFGSPFIETEHLLLGILREDKALANRFLRSPASFDSIRKQIERHTVPQEKIPTSVDLPLSRDCKRALMYAAEEAGRLNHGHIGTEHLLLGLLREEKCFAAQVLSEQGLTLDSVRNELGPSQTPATKSRAASFAGFEQWLADCEARGDFCIVREKPGDERTLQFALYPVDQAKENEKGPTVPAAAQLAKIQIRINFVTERMENAVANHEFDKARFYSEEERQERENLRLLREQFNLEDSPPPAPLLRIEIIRDEPFWEVQQRCDECLAEGVSEIWLLHLELKRAYTVTRADGLRECRAGILQFTNPPLEMDLKAIFE